MNNVYIIFVVCFKWYGTVRRSFHLVSICIANESVFDTFLRCVNSIVLNCNL